MPQAGIRYYQPERLAKGLAKSIVFDTAHFGRKAGETYVDRFDTNSFSVRIDYEYRDDFLFGLIPYRTTTQSAVSGTRHSESLTQSYDPISRRLVGVELDHTGKASTNTWDYRWESAREVETALRKTVSSFNRDETAVTGATVSQASGEEISRFAGQFDAPSSSWRMDRTLWYRPGIANRQETETFSAFGKPLP